MAFWWRGDWKQSVQSVSKKWPAGGRDAVSKMPRLSQTSRAAYVCETELRHLEIAQVPLGEKDAWA